MQFNLTIKKESRKILTEKMNLEKNKTEFGKK